MWPGHKDLEKVCARTAQGPYRLGGKHCGDTQVLAHVLGVWPSISTVDWIVTSGLEAAVAYLMAGACLGAHPTLQAVHCSWSWATKRCENAAILRAGMSM